MVKTSFNTELLPKKKGNSPSPTPMDTSPLESPIPLQIINSPPPFLLTGGETSLGPKSSKSSTEKEPKKRNPKRPKLSSPISTMADDIEGEKDTCTDDVEEQAKNLVPGFAINTVWCKSSKFTEFLDVLETQKWLKLVGDFAKYHIYPQAIKEFCSSFSFKDDTCYGIVNGTKIEFDAAYLANLFEVPNAGFDVYFKGKFKVDIDGATNTDILHFIGGTGSSTVTHHNKFSPFQKLLFNLVRRLVVPRTQKRNEANLRDATLMYCLAKNIPVNFPSLMIKHLHHCIPYLKIGYGSFLTCVFQSFSIDLSAYPALPLKPEQILNSDTLSLLGLKVVDGKTVFDKEKQVREIGEEEKEKDKEEEETEKEQAKSRVVPKRKLKEKIEPEEKKTVPKGKRKSVRIATQVVKNPGPPVFLDITGEEVLEENEEAVRKEAEEVEFMEQDTPPRNNPPVPKRHGVSVLTKEEGTQHSPSGVPSGFHGFRGFSGLGGSSSGLQSLEQEVKELQDLTGSMISKQEALDHKLTLIQTAVTTMVKAISDLHQGFTALQDTVTTSHTSILEKINEVAFEEVQEPDNEPQP